MKVQLQDTSVIIGKRVTLGAAFTSLAAALGFIFPEHAAAITAMAVPVTFIAQVFVAHKFGVTSNVN
jgi:hypothetical protein